MTAMNPTQLEITPHGSDTDTDDEAAGLIREAVQLQQQRGAGATPSAHPLLELPAASGGEPPTQLLQRQSTSGLHSSLSESLGAIQGLPMPEEVNTGAADSKQAAPAQEPVREPTMSLVGKVVKPTSLGKRSVTISIKQLVEAGVLQPGPDVLCVDYKGQSTLAELTAEGRIQYCGILFDSPSAFSIYVKRLVNPTRKADDGWKSVKYGGKLLETYKVVYQERQQ